VRGAPAGELPYARQKLVGLARALAPQPDLLLLDEPSAAMHAHDRAAFARILLRIQRELAIPMLWIEHDMELVSRVAGRVAALDAGRLIATGSPETVLRDPQVVRAYLGAVGSAARRSDEGDS
jgi:branched-chain amino acid transport system ATP-binding protein